MRWLALCMAASALLLAGCGLPATPLPPSLDLPAPVTDLSAARTGDQVALTWTMPKRDTSRVDLRGSVTTRICRRQGTGSCVTVATLQLVPAANGTFTETLPAALAAGAPRALSYFVELVNKRGRSAGLSNAGIVLAGEAPAPVASLDAKLRRDGVVLRWTPGPPEPYATVVRLERTLLASAGQKPAAASKPAPGALAEPAEENLLVPANGERGAALDKDIRFGEIYEYRAQRIATLTVEGTELELDGPLSPPVRVDAQNVFAPLVPTGLAAVFTPAENGAGPAIDLSWQPDTDADLAGYAVYRREAAQPESAWQRISGAQPEVGPGFHDPHVQAGHTYEYAVTAIGQNGRESGKSSPAQETVPQN